MYGSVCVPAHENSCMYPCVHALGGVHCVCAGTYTWVCVCAYETRRHWQDFKVTVCEKTSRQLQLWTIRGGKEIKLSIKQASHCSSGDQRVGCVGKLDETSSTKDSNGADQKTNLNFITPSLDCIFLIKSPPRRGHNTSSSTFWTTCKFIPAQ